MTAQQLRENSRNDAEAAISDPPAESLAGWIPAELAADTVALFSRIEGRPVSMEEAVEILTNVKRLGEVLFDILRERDRQQ